MKRYIVEIKQGRKWETHANWPSRETAEADAQRVREATGREVRIREVETK